MIHLYSSPYGLFSRLLISVAMFIYSFVFSSDSCRPQTALSQCTQSFIQSICLVDLQFVDCDDCHYITLQKTIYSGLSISNFKDHYGYVVITQCRHLTVV